MKKILSFIITIFLILFMIYGISKCVRRFKNKNLDIIKNWTQELYYNDGQDIVIDEYNNLYITGINIGEGNFKEAYLCKYDQHGKKVWCDILNSIGYNIQGLKLFIVDNDSIYLSGTTNISINNQKLNGKQDLFIIRYNLSGDIIWTKTVGFPKAVIKVSGIVIDEKQNIYISGESDRDEKGNVFTNKNAFLLKMSHDFIIKWVHFIGVKEKINNNIHPLVSTSSDIFYIDNYIYLTGFTNTSLSGKKLNIKNYHPIYIYDNNKYLYSYFLKFSTQGQIISKKLIDNPGIIKFDNYGNYYIINQLKTQKNIYDNNSFEISSQIIKFQKNGKKEWEKNLGNEENDIIIYDIIEDNKLNLFITGVSNNKKNNGPLKAFVQKYSKNGNSEINYLYENVPNKQSSIISISKRILVKDNICYVLGLILTPIDKIQNEFIKPINTKDINHWIGFKINTFISTEFNKNK